MNKNQLVTNAVRDFIRNNSTINPYDSRDKVLSDFEKISQDDEIFRKEKKPGPRRIKKKRGKPKL
tara:strand:- start:98 stop:292 length:195 start_codon:yes stop_codon:yes gene_type:complete